MSSLNGEKEYLIIAIVFAAGALTVASYSIWAQFIAMAAIAIFSMCRFFGHQWSIIPLVACLLVTLINQALGIFYTVQFWKVWEANGRPASTISIKFGFSVFFLIACLYAIYVTARNRKGT